MNFDGFSGKVPIARFGGLVEWDDPTQLPFGVASVVKNSRYTAQSVGTRYGTKKTFVTGANNPIAGLGLLKYLSTPDVKLPFIYDAAGAMWYENPQGSGNKTAIADPFRLLGAGNQAQMEQAYNKNWIAQSDLVEGKLKPCVVDGATKNLDPVSDKPVGVPWTAATKFRLKHVIAPTVANGHLYQASAVTTGVTAGVEPVWPLTEGGTIVDGGVTWKEVTPVMAQALTPIAPVIARVGGVGTFPVNRDVYIRITLKNGQGESVGSAALSIINTVLSDRVQVTLPALAAFPGWVQALAPPYSVVEVGVYEADVATGGAAPADAAYHKVAGGPYAFGAVVNVDAAAAGAVIPTINSATVVPAGNICSGPRWMVVIFVNRNGYFTGMSDAVPVQYIASSSGLQLYVANIFTGPANTAQRICAFTVAGPSNGTFSNIFNGSAGPFKYVPQNDTFSSVKQTTTVINDNVTTTATFNFIDDYLVDAPEVTDCFLKIEIPECTDMFFSRILNRMVYAGVKGYPTNLMISDEADIETVRSPNSLVAAGINTGERIVCARETDQAVWIFKENSAHLLTPQGGDPNTWNVLQQWTGSGPCGPRAIDIATGIMAYAHENGLYVKLGSSGPVIMSRELLKTWPSINWAYKHTIWVKIDDDAQEVLVGVPIGANQTVPNKILRLNYRFGWDDPVVFSVRVGKLIPMVNARKWSIDDIAANTCLIAKRDLVASVDARIDHKQVLFGSSVTGLVSMQTPDFFSDEDKDGAKQGIDWQYQTVKTPNDGMVIMQLGGITLSMKGSGKINVNAVRDDGTAAPFTFDARTLFLQANENGFDAAVKNEQHERWNITFDNGAKADVWAELHKGIVHMRAMWASRKG